MAYIVGEDELARIAEAVPEWDEPPICGCGRHYTGIPCPNEEGL